MKTLSDTVVNMPRSGIRTIMEMAFEQSNVIHLEAGEPDFPTPEHIGEAGIRAIKEGYTKYTPGGGVSFSPREDSWTNCGERMR